MEEAETENKQNQKCILKGKSSLAKAALSVEQGSSCISYPNKQLAEGATGMTGNATLMVQIKKFISFAIEMVFPGHPS